MSVIWQQKHKTYILDQINQNKENNIYLSLKLSHLYRCLDNPGIKKMRFKLKTNKILERTFFICSYIVTKYIKKLNLYNIGYLINMYFIYF